MPLNTRGYDDFNTSLLYLTVDRSRENMHLYVAIIYNSKKIQTETLQRKLYSLRKHDIFINVLLPFFSLMLSRLREHFRSFICLIRGKD